MKRTIEIKNRHLYYRGKLVDYVPNRICEYFNFGDNSKYRITITEGGEYRFIEKNDHLGKWYYIYEGRTRVKGGNLVGWVCQEEFDKLFFVPDCKKTYDIKVKRIPVE